MISIRKYLNSSRKDEGGPEPQLLLSENLCKFSAAILDSIHQFVLTDDAGKARRSQILQLRDSLRADWNAEEAAQAASQVSSILSVNQSSAKRAGVEQLLEAQHILAMLNQALVVLAEGSDRGVSRLATIQESLQRVSIMRDMSQMKASLAETVDFIRTEAAQARETATQELGKFETEVSTARGFFGGTRLELAGRPEGVAEIADSMKHLEDGEALYLVAYLCDRLNAVTQRYGPDVAEELVCRLIKERLKPVIPGNTMFRWTASSLVAVFSRPRDAEKVRKEVADLNKTPLVHKIVLSGRTAVLTISPSHMVAEGSGSAPDLLVEQVDRFTLA
jgi:hypothetical protein